MGRRAKAEAAEVSVVAFMAFEWLSQAGCAAWRNLCKKWKKVREVASRP
jgi:hypothetical protein